MVKRRLGTMLGKIEDQLAAADEKIGDSKLLDMDNDGIVTTDELHAAITNVIGGNRTEEEIDSIVRKLDIDDDALVTIHELEELVKAARRRDKHHVAEILVDAVDEEPEFDASAEAEPTQEGEGATVEAKAKQD